MKIIFHPDAEEEMVFAAQYYEDRAPGLGVAFLEELEKGIDRIANSPFICPILSGQVRRYLLDIFPFGILYRVEREQIFILAIMHRKRRPNYWKDRN